MNFNNDDYTTYLFSSIEDLKQFFPWLGEEFEFESRTVEVKPKSKRGRKPKAHRASGEGVKMEATV